MQKKNNKNLIIQGPYPISRSHFKVTFVVANELLPEVN